MSGTPVRLVPAGDSAVIVEFEDRIDERINARAIRLASAVESRRLAGVRDVVPTYRTVAVYFDPLRTDYDRLTDLLEREADAAAQPPDVGSGFSRIGSRDHPLQGPPKGGPHTNVGSGFSRIDAVEGPPKGGPHIPVGYDIPAEHDIPVCYGGECGPDLPDVAAYAHLSEAEVVARHSGVVYRVFMMGFVPGFTYLGTVDPAIAVPRRATPRVRVPAGSVGIAGSQTGIYPSETPGGWQLVGRTPLKLFDLARANPFLLQPGDTVRFHPITATDYARAVAG